MNQRIWTSVCLTLILLGVLAITPTAEAAQNVVVLVDDSGSMSDPMDSGVRRIEAAKRSLNVVLSKLPADAQVGVLALNQGWIVPLQPLDHDQATSQINRLRANGGTLLGQNLKSAADALLKVRQDKTYGDYRLLIVTDGEANDQEVLDFVLPDVMSRGLIVDVIGVDMSSDHSLATRVNKYRRADDAESLETAIAESLAESDATDVVGEESDFELLAGLPADIAMSVISSLTSAENGPVGGEDFDPSEHSRNRIGFNYGPGNSGQTNTGGDGFGFGAIFCMGVVFFAVATISSMMKAAKRSR